MDLLAAMSESGWHPGIGDPTFIGWLIAIAYLLAAGVSFRAGTRERRLPAGLAPRVLPAFWFTVAATLLLLGINKQLDLQTWLTVTARAHAKSCGWYSHRREYQAVFVAGIGTSGLMSLSVLTWLLRRVWRRYWLALSGIICLTCFVIIRAASFHHADEMLGHHWGDLRLNHVFELSGIIIVFISACSCLRSLPAAAGDNRRRGQSLALTLQKPPP